MDTHKIKHFKEKLLYQSQVIESQNIIIKFLFDEIRSVKLRKHKK